MISFFVVAKEKYLDFRIIVVGLYFIQPPPLVAAMRTGVQPIMACFVICCEKFTTNSGGTPLHTAATASGSYAKWSPTGDG